MRVLGELTLRARLGAAAQRVGEVHRRREVVDAHHGAAGAAARFWLFWLMYLVGSLISKG